jgi:hypothetical protein
VKRLTLRRTVLSLKEIKSFRTQIMRLLGYQSLQTNEVSMINPDLRNLDYAEQQFKTPFVQMNAKGKK